ncbi:MAG: hypothetical protein AB8B67_02145 [Rickettsiaceae bacterium]
MSYDITCKFQIALYNLLLQDSNLSKTVNRIYLSVIQDGKYPFILINILNSQYANKFDYILCKLEFDICVFAKDKNQISLMQIANQILNTITIEGCRDDAYQIHGIKDQSINFERGKDLITSKLSIHYRTLISAIKNQF